MVELGECINAANSVPSAAHCRALGMRGGNWVRTAIQGSLALIPPMLDQLPPEISVMLTVNNECFEVGSDWSGWDHTMRLIVQMGNRYPGRIKIVGCGNELDAYYNNGDQRASPAFAADLVRRASPILRPAGIKVAMPSVASGSWPDYLQQMAAACWWAADYADLHLYVKVLNGIPHNANPLIWQDANEAIAQAKRMAPNNRLICSEAGIKVDDAGGLDEQAWWALGLPELDADVVCHFTLDDHVGSPSEQGGQAFGAIDLNGARKPLWGALQAVYGGPTTPPSKPPKEPVFVLGFEKWHDLEPGLIGDAVKNEHYVHPDWNTQPTTYGVLSWVKGKGHSFVTHEGRIFRWQEEWVASQEIT